MIEPIKPNLAVRRRSNPVPAAASASASVPSSPSCWRLVSHWHAKSPLPMIRPELAILTLTGCFSSSRAYRLPPLLLALVVADDVEHARRTKLRRCHIGCWIDRIGLSGLWYFGGAVSWGAEISAGTCPQHCTSIVIAYVIHHLHHRQRLASTAPPRTATEIDGLLRLLGFAPLLNFDPGRSRHQSPAHGERLAKLAAVLLAIDRSIDRHSGNAACIALASPIRSTSTCTLPAALRPLTHPHATDIHRCCGRSRGRQQDDEHHAAARAGAVGGPGASTGKRVGLDIHPPARALHPHHAPLQPHHHFP